MTELIRQIDWKEAARSAVLAVVVVLLSPVLLMVGVFYLLAEWERV